MTNLNGRVAIVTGGTSGIGGAISSAFLNAGATVIAVYGSNDAKAKKFKEKTSGNIETVKLDVSDYLAVKQFFDNFLEKHEKLDIVVNSAGVRQDSIVGMMKEEDWKKVIDINLTGTFNICKFAVMAMVRKRYGRIINITSPSGKIGIEGQANYSASKAGQVAFTKSLSKEVAKRNITANCISPGFIDTDFISGLPEEARKAYQQSVPMKRFGKPDEVSPAALFLASEEASYITGSVLEVTGGL